MARGPDAGLVLIDRLEARGELRGYHHLSAARAELLARSGRTADAVISYRRAIDDCGNPTERCTPVWSARNACYALFNSLTTA
jgi:RNA polymerase sigma-70 factor (ECF subfamily)